MPGEGLATTETGDLAEEPQTRDSLRTGLNTIGYRYRIEKAMRNAKTNAELKKELSRLYEAGPTIVAVLDDDIRGSGEIEAILSDPWRGNQVPRLVEELRSLLPKLKIALGMVQHQRGTIKRRQQDP